MSTLQVNTIENRSGERFDLGGGNKNLLINGSMNIWQRSISATVTGGFHTADRWDTNFTGLGTFTQSQSTDVPSGQGFGYSLKMDCTSADTSPAATDKLFIEQKLEGQNLQHILKSTSSAKKITLSFWVKSNKTGTYVVKIIDADGRYISKAYTISSASTWEKKTITVVGDTGGSAIDNDNTEGLGIQWWLGAGSNFTTSLQGTWALVTDDYSAQGQVNLADSTSNEWYMTGCQLEVGSQATSFEFEPFETILRKCQRYYEEGAFMGIFSEGNNTYGWSYYKVTKRAAPTVTTTTPTGTTTNQANYYSTASADRVAITLNMINDAGPQVLNASGSGNASNTFTDEDYRSMFYHGNVTYTPTSSNDATYFGRFYADSEL